MSSPHGSVCRHPFCAGAHGTQWRPRAQAGRRPPPSRRGAVRPYLPDFRLHPPAIPQGALHILRQFSACARRHPAGARRVLTCQISVCVRPPARRARCTSCASSPPAPAAAPQGRARYTIHRISTCARRRSAGARCVLTCQISVYIRPARARYVIHRISACARRQPAGARCVLTCQISVYIRPPSRRGARGTSFTGFPPAPAASPQGRTARNPAGWIPAFPRATTPRTAWTVRGGIGALRLCTLHGIRAFAGICRSGVRSLRISRSGNQARIPAAVRSPVPPARAARRRFAVPALSDSVARYTHPDNGSLSAHLPLGQPSAHPAAVRSPASPARAARRRFAVPALSGSAARYTHPDSGVRSLRIFRSGNQARIPAAVRSPRLPLGRRGGGSLSLCRLAQPPRYAARTRSSARTSAAAPDMVIMPVPST